jgi:hypothetical protein
LAKLSSLEFVGPISLRLANALIKSYSATNGRGIPRGLAISATFAEVVLKDFDKAVAHKSGVYFYARYVDDIIVVTNHAESSEQFLRHVRNNLPVGLSLNDRKTQCVSIDTRVAPIASSAASTTAHLCEFEFLGYAFKVHQPIKSGPKNSLSYYRSVEVEISNRKIRKLKTRIVRSMLQFRKDGNWTDLLDRITFLTSNFNIHDYNTAKRKLAGIYYGYPQLTAEKSISLMALDNFLRSVILSKSGRLCSSTGLMPSSRQKRVLLSKSFIKGHAKRLFTNFSMTRIKEIQECWIYE